MPDNELEQAKNNEERCEEIKMLFYAALNKVKEYTNEFDLDCSTNVEFGGFIDELYTPVSLVFVKSKNMFIIYFSSHFTNNSNDKIMNMFIRYIITTNKDNTFKVVNEVKEEMKKLPFETHHDVAFRNNYLISDSPVTNGVICESCLRIYRCSVDSDLFKHPENYRCQCSPTGGKLALIINGKKQMDPKKMDFYQTLTLDDVNKVKKERETRQKISAALLTEDNFDLDTFDEDALKEINKIIADNPRGVNRKHVGEFVDTYIDKPEYLSMAAQAFPHQYYNAYRYAGYDKQKIIFENPITHPRWEDWNYETEKQRIETKTKNVKRQAAKPQNVEEVINSLNVNETTRMNLLAATENKGKKISRMKVAEYIESSIATGDKDFLEALNDNFPDIYLEAFKHLHGVSRGYLYKNFAPKSSKFNEEFMKKYPENKNASNRYAYEIKDKPIVKETNADPMTKLNAFMRMYKRIGNKEIMHEINDAVFNEDVAYLKLLRGAFNDKFMKVRPSFSNSVLDFLDRNGI